MHCPAGNATDPIWRVLASSDGISSWTPFKPQHCIPCLLSVQWEPSACISCQCCQKKVSSKVCGWICSVWPSWVWESQYTSTGNAVSWSLGHSNRSSFHRMAFFPISKQNFIAYRSSKVQIAFFKFTSSDNKALVGCIPIAAVAVHLNSLEIYWMHHIDFSKAFDSIYRGKIELIILAYGFQKETVMIIVGWLFGFYGNICKLFKAKSIFIQIVSSISKNSV